MAEVLFSTYTEDVNPVSAPTGFSALFNSGDARVSSQQWYSATATQATWFDDTVLASDDIAAEVKVALITSDSRGPGLMSAAGSGYILLVRNTDLRLFLYTDGVLGAQITPTITMAIASNDLVKLGRKNSTGLMTAYVGGASVGTWTNNTHTADLLGVCFSRSGRISEFRTEGAEAAASIVSINGDNTVVQGSADNTIVTTLLDVSTLSIGGIAVTLTEVDPDNHTWPMPGFVDSEVYPEFEAVTASANAGEATKSVTLSLDPLYTPRVMETLSEADDSIATVAAAQGLTIVPDDTLYNSAGLTTYTDSTVSDAEEGTHIVWHRAAATNVMTQINLIISNGAIVTGRLTASALTARSLTARSLTARAA